MAKDNVKCVVCLGIKRKKDTRPFELDETIYDHDGQILMPKGHHRLCHGCESCFMDATKIVLTELEKVVNSDPRSVISSESR